MGEPPLHRVFFALWPDEEATSHLAALGHALVSRDGRAMRPATLHLTLAFIGGVTPTQLETLHSVGDGICAESFNLSLDRLGFWPQRGILWAGCRQSPSGLRRLSENLDAGLQAAGFVPAREGGASLVPHVTLARGVRCRDLPRLETPIRWRVEEFLLVESHLRPGSASYSSLGAFPLSDSAPA